MLYRYIFQRESQAGCLNIISNTYGPCELDFRCYLSRIKSWEHINIKIEKDETISEFISRCNNFLDEIAREINKVIVSYINKSIYGGKSPYRQSERASEKQYRELESFISSVSDNAKQAMDVAYKSSQQHTELAVM